MLLSNTYRQSSENPPFASSTKDPDNRLLWRFNRQRLQAEAIRDSILFVSGRLNLQRGGPSVFPYQPPGIWEELSRGETFTAQEYHESTGTDLYREKGVYEKDVSMKSFWENDAIVWSEGIKQMDLVIKDNSGGSGHAHKRKDSEKFFPTKMRITMIQVSAGSKYDPSLVPNLPRATGEGAKPIAVT